jgi:hypothetical protein
MKELRLAHGWRLANAASLSPETIRDFLRGAVRAVPPALAARIGGCRIEVLPVLDPPELSSRWAWAAGVLAIQVAAGQTGPHDMALELLIAIGHSLWERISSAERGSWLRLLDAEVTSGVGGEIDDEVLELKRTLLGSRAAAGDLALIERYAAASYAATLAEYVHCLWHDVTVRPGPEHLEPGALRRRLELFARWFPPGRGQRLFA